MPKTRYSDAELRLMTEAAKALEPVMAECGYRDLLYGKWALLTEDVRQELATREIERRTMFVSPFKQIENLAKWNAARGWGFNEDDIALLKRDMPAEPPPPEKGQLQLKARVLEIHLHDSLDGVPGVRRTFDELWDIVVKEQGARPCHLFGLAKDVRLTLVPGYVHHPGLRWRMIDFGYGWPEPDLRCVRFCGTPPRKLPLEAERVHAGILAAAAYFPLWMARMDGRHVPYVWLPGYELHGAPHGLGHMGSTRLVQHPRLTRGGGMFIYYGWDHVMFDDHAVPVYADVLTRPAHPEVEDVDGFSG